MASATSDISCVCPTQQNLLSTSITIQPSSSESSNKTLRGETSQEKMEEMLANCRNKRWKVPAKLAREDGETGKPFFQKERKVYKKTQTMT